MTDLLDQFEQSIRDTNAALDALEAEMVRQHEEMLRILDEGIAKCDAVLAASK